MSGSDLGPENVQVIGLANGSGSPSPARQTDRHMLEALVCPVTNGRLSYDAARQELISKAAHLAFPIRGGIPIMLVDEARDID